MIWLALIFAGIIFLSMFFYFPFVFLNLTFTFVSLDASHIPFYAGVGGDLPRYGFVWWLLATDILRLIPAIYVFFILGVPFSPSWRELRSSTYQTIFRIITLFFWIWEIVKLVIYSIYWIWDSTSVLDDCYEPGCSALKDVNNTIFYVIWAYTAFYVLWLFAGSIFVGRSIGDYLQSGGKPDIPKPSGVLYEQATLKSRINSKMEKRH